MLKSISGFYLNDIGFNCHKRKGCKSLYHKVNLETKTDQLRKGTYCNAKHTLLLCNMCSFTT